VICTKHCDCDEFFCNRNDDDLVRLASFTPAVCDDDPGDHQSLYWEEVKRVRSSDFERWKLVKSTVSGYAHLTVSKIKPAEQFGGHTWTPSNEIWWLILTKSHANI